jgi:drug/metabolite transporter (DMT)-like permease
MFKGFRYFRPVSLTWWSGALMIIIGVLMILNPDSNKASAIAEVLAAFSGGDSSPASLIFLGSGLIGLGDKFARKEDV